MLFFSRTRAFPEKIEVQHTIYFEWPYSQSLFAGYLCNALLSMYGHEVYLSVTKGSSGQLSVFSFGFPRNIVACQTHPALVK